MQISGNKKIRLVLPEPLNLDSSANWFSRAFQIILEQNKRDLVRKGFYIRGTRINDSRFVDITDPRVISSVVRPVGKIFMFSYIPEGKHDPNLPYYDRFPLLLLMGRDKHGFEGFNLHYIPLEYRLRIMMRLSNAYLIAEKSFEPRFFFKYDSIKNDPNFRYLKASYRRYTNKYMESLLFEVKPEHWGSVLYAPFSLFMKDGNFIPNMMVWREQMIHVMQDSKGV